MSGALLIAVDGGNSKTDVVLLRTDGSVAAAVRGPGSNPHFLTTAGTLNLIERLIDTAWRQTGADPRSHRPKMSTAAFFLAGADQPGEVRDLRDAIAGRGWADDVLVGNDTLALLWAGSTSGSGVAVVVGAGVNGVGRAESGVEAHFAALGEVTGDWGGGPGIGLAALGAAVRAEEGRAPATALSALIATHFGEPTSLDVAIAVHRGQIAGRRLGELPPLVFEAAQAGDAESLAMVDRQADEVIAFAVAALRRTQQTDAAAEVILGGSVLTSGPPRLIDRVRAGVAAVAPRAQVVLWTGRPVLGAAIAVLNASGADDAARLRVRSELTDDRITVLGDGAAGRTE
jgi:N-acetylglucosamine kinase-like BadF-type ATPase